MQFWQAVLYKSVNKLYFANKQVQAISKSPILYQKSKGSNTCAIWCIPAEIIIRRREEANSVIRTARPWFGRTLKQVRKLSRKWVKEKSLRIVVRQLSLSNTSFAESSFFEKSFFKLSSFVLSYFECFFPKMSNVKISFADLSICRVTLMFSTRNVV